MYTSRNWQPEVASLDQKSRQCIFNGTFKAKHMNRRKALARIEKYTNFPHEYQNMVLLLAEFANKALTSYNGYSNSQSPYSLLFDAELKLLKMKCVTRTTWCLGILWFLILTTTIVLAYRTSTYTIELWVVVLIVGILGFFGKLALRTLFGCNVDEYQRIFMHPSIDADEELNQFLQMTDFYELLDLLPAFTNKVSYPYNKEWWKEITVAVKQQSKSFAKTIEENTPKDLGCEALRAKLRRLIELSLLLKFNVGDPSLLFTEAFAKEKEE